MEVYFQEFFLSLVHDVNSVPEDTFVCQRQRSFQILLDGIYGCALKTKQNKNHPFLNFRIVLDFRN